MINLINRLIIFVSNVWRVDPQYGFIDAGLAWELAGILEKFGRTP